jgi:hypothetical protein
MKPKKFLQRLADYHGWRRSRQPGLVPAAVQVVADLWAGAMVWNEASGLRDRHIREIIGHIRSHRPTFVCQRYGQILRMYRSRSCWLILHNRQAVYYTAFPVALVDRLEIESFAEFVDEGDLGR